MNMASKSSNRQERKLTPEQKIKRVLAVLDSVVQEWYAENNPGNKSHYASVHICDYEDGIHASRITLIRDSEGEHYKVIASSKCSKEIQI